MARVPAELGAGQVRLRRLDPRDLDELMAILTASQAEVGQWLPAFTGGVDREVEVAFLARAKETFTADLDYGFAVVDDAGHMVGGAGLHPLEEGRASIGYWAASERTGRGQTTAVAEALTSVAFGRLGVDVVEIQCDSANHASAAIPARLGFRLASGHAREILCPGHTGWGLVWEMRAVDWRQGRSQASFRLAGPEDRPALVAAFPDSAEYFDERLAEGPELAELILAEEAGLVAGDACLRWDEPVESEIGRQLPDLPYPNHVEVTAPARRRGIAARLVLAAESLAKERGADRIWLGVEPDNPGARRLYERLGYSEWPHGPVATGWTYRREGVEHEYRTTIYILVKTLRRSRAPV